MTFNVGDKVRTIKRWNEDYDKIEGIVTKVKTIKLHKTQKSYHKGPSGFTSILESTIPGEFECTTVLCIEGEKEELHESWFELVN